MPICNIAFIITMGSVLQYGTKMLCDICKNFNRCKNIYIHIHFVIYYNHVSIMTDGMTIVVYLNATDDRFVFDWDVTPYTSFATGARVVMHRPGTFPHTQDGFTIGPGQEARIITTHHTHIHQESHSKDCSDTTTLQVFTDPDDNPRSDCRYHKIRYGRSKFIFSQLLSHKVHLCTIR